jgi:hypothetical protein
MRRFLRLFRSNENDFACGEIPPCNFSYIFFNIIFLFSFCFSYSQKNSFSSFSSFSNSSNSIAGNFHQQKNTSQSYTKYFEDNGGYSNHFATITSTTAGGNWDDIATWIGGSVPSSGDDVIIDGPVTVNTGLAASHDLAINAGASLSFNAGMLLEINGNYINDGTLLAGTGNISFTGSGSSTISGSAASAFNNVIVNKTPDLTTILEATGAGGGAISNTGDITIMSGLFKMTAGTFKFTSDPNIPNTAGL